TVLLPAAMPCDLSTSSCPGWPGTSSGSVLALLRHVKRPHKLHGRLPVGVVARKLRSRCVRRARTIVRACKPCTPNPPPASGPSRWHGVITRFDEQLGRGLRKECSYNRGLRA